MTAAARGKRKQRTEETKVETDNDLGEPVLSDEIVIEEEEEDDDFFPAGNKEFGGKEVVFDKGSRREAKQFWGLFPG